MLANLRSTLTRVGLWPRRLFALACLALAILAFASPGPTPRRSVKSQQVLVATRTLPVGHRLTRGDLTLRLWPTDLVSEGTAESPDELVGKTLAAPVARGDPMSSRRVVGRDLTAGLASGQVAAVVAVDGSNATALIRAGDRVDVLGSPRPADSTGLSSPSDAAATSSSTSGPVLLASGVRVLAVLTGPGGFDDSAQVVVATSRALAARLIRVSSSQMFTLLPRAP